MSLRYRLFAVICLSCFGKIAYAELVFSAPPRESSAAGSELYGPLADHLSALLGEKVVYQHPNNWLEYQRDLRKGVYDIVFDGPHFVSWRMAHLDHDVLVKLPGSLEFLIVVRSDDPESKTHTDLIGKKICAIPPPNLATLTAINLFNNPVRQPVIWGVGGGYQKVYDQFINGECRAAVFRKTFFDKKLTPKQRQSLRVIYKSKPLPNQAISVSNKIDKHNRQRIIRSMTLGKGRVVSKSIAKRFGGVNSKSFVTATRTEYSNISDLLEGVVYGW